MSALQSCQEPGVLMVLAQVKSAEYFDAFHDWYNTEHGPARLKLDFVRNGYRYRRREDPTVWMAIYDLTRLSAASEEGYLSLRRHRSPREQYVMTNMMNVLSRSFFRLVSSHGTANGPAPIVRVVSVTAKTEEVDRMGDWFEQDLVPQLSQVRGWRRSRRFELVDGDGTREGHATCLAVNEFDQDHDYDDTEHDAWWSVTCRRPLAPVEPYQDGRQFDFYHEFFAEDYRVPPAAEEVAHSVGLSVMPTAVSDMYWGRATAA